MSKFFLITEIKFIHEVPLFFFCHGDNFPVKNKIDRFGIKKKENITPNRFNFAIRKCTNGRKVVFSGKIMRNIFDNILPNEYYSVKYIRHGKPTCTS